MNLRAIRPVRAGRVLAATGRTALVLAASGALLAACGRSAAPIADPPATVTTTVSASPSAPASQPGSGGASTAPSATSSGTASPPGCLTRYLHGVLTGTNGAAGSVYSVIVFRNLSDVSCTLYGFPGVAVSRGLPVSLVGATARQDPSTSRKLVTLPPHGYAHANLRVVQAANFPAGTCHPVTVHWLQVIPPNQVAPLYIPYTTQTCQDKSTPTMTISAVRGGRS